MMSYTSRCVCLLSSSSGGSSMEHFVASSPCPPFQGSDFWSPDLLFSSLIITDTRNFYDPLTTSYLLITRSRHPTRSTVSSVPYRLNPLPSSTPRRCTRNRHTRTRRAALIPCSASSCLRVQLPRVYAHYAHVPLSFSLFSALVLVSIIRLAFAHPPRSRFRRVEYFWLVVVVVVVV
ncbi:hypothetical protein BDY24DRAFT_401827 [Mrakia frigida]|uniref:uncharacterized protein n=1 Tax=Mrakia frigida TaxID=29902 RepID=UPI003FCBEF1A